MKKTCPFSQRIVNTLFMSCLFCLTVLFLSGCGNKAKDSAGMTPLHCAAVSRTDNVEVIQFLVSQGVDINAKNNKGQTPLNLTQYRNRICKIEEINKEIIEYLSSVGAKF